MFILDCQRITSDSLCGGADAGTAYPAKGQYKFSLSGVRWNSTATLKGGKIAYQGQAEIEYAYAFGA